MISVIVERDEFDRITSFEMSGHADYAEHGKDLVCAGASAVSFGAVNAVYALTKVEPIIEQGREGGYLKVSFPKTAEDERVQTIIEAMIIALQTIETDYHEHIKISQSR
ncbi:ribosomal-processing cysteine protease Prp [Savagea faecisuis]|uniref:Ribosomal processing cysteine protease Prp n=2 Tax=Bacillales TaxID=1385 RepID=A0ABW3GXC4_9BACL